MAMATAPQRVTCVKARHQPGCYNGLPQTGVIA